MHFTCKRGTEDVQFMSPPQPQGKVSLGAFICEIQQADAGA